MWAYWLFIDKNISLTMSVRQRLVLENTVFLKNREDLAGRGGDLG
ncbi:hypothetical protein SDC9_111911 [bioreactor metagenome]|uniref:Uncharacterized protein n=1 Tax=bioreactor metagenome TaxID=1076179 RepID=A0A645BHS3_9ZZZZ